MKASVDKIVKIERHMDEVEMRDHQIRSVIYEVRARIVELEEAVLPFLKSRESENTHEDDENSIDMLVEEQFPRFPNMNIRQKFNRIRRDSEMSFVEDFYGLNEVTLPSEGSDKDKPVYRKSCTSASSSEEDSGKSGLRKENRAHSCTELGWIGKERDDQEEKISKCLPQRDRRGSEKGTYFVFQKHFNCIAEMTVLVEKST